MPKKKRGRKTARKRTSKKHDNDRLFAFLATFFCIIGVALIFLLNKKNDYTAFYAKQGIVIFIFWLITIALGRIHFFGWAIWVLFIVLWVMAWLNALSGKKKNTFLISEFSNKINL